MSEEDASLFESPWRNAARRDETHRARLEAMVGRQTEIQERGLALQEAGASCRLESAGTYVSELESVRAHRAAVESVMERQIVVSERIALALERIAGLISAKG